MTRSTAKSISQFPSDTMITRFINNLVSASAIIGAMSLILMMLVIVADVLSANLFGKPIPAASVVVTAYFMVLTVFLPMALAQKTDAHVVVDVVYQHFPRTLRRIVDFVTALMVILICGMLIVALWNDALRKTAISSFIFEQSIRVPTWPGYYALPVGFGLMALVIAVQLVSSFTRSNSRDGAEQGSGKNTDDK